MCTQPARDVQYAVGGMISRVTEKVRRREQLRLKITAEGAVGKVVQAVRKLPGIVTN